MDAALRTFLARKSDKSNPGPESNKKGGIDSLFPVYCFFSFFNQVKQQYNFHNAFIIPSCWTFSSVKRISTGSTIAENVHGKVQSVKKWIENLISQGSV